MWRMLILCTVAAALHAVAADLGEDAEYGEACLLLQQSSYKEARPKLDNVLKRFPVSGRVFHSAGVAAEKSGDKGAAIQYYTRGALLAAKDDKGGTWCRESLVALSPATVLVLQCAADCRAEARRTDDEKVSDLLEAAAQALRERAAGCSLPAPEAAKPAPGAAGAVADPGKKNPLAKATGLARRALLERNLGYKLKGHPRDAKKGPTGCYYQFINEPCKWDEAVERCKAKGGYLACVTGQPEWEFVLELCKHGNVWLGGTDKDKDGDWRWVTGEPFEFKCWGNGEPNGGNGETAVHITGGDRWNDSGPQNGLGYICEWEH